MVARKSGMISLVTCSGRPQYTCVPIAPIMTTMLMTAPAKAVRLVRSNRAAAVSRTPIPTRNQTGKCHARNAFDHPLVSSNLDMPCLMKTHARNSANTPNTLSSASCRLFSMCSPLGCIQLRARIWKKLYPMRMRVKEIPHLFSRVDAPSSGAEYPLRHAFPTGPDMTSSADGVQQHRRIFGTAGVFAANDISGDRRIYRLRVAPISSSPVGCPCRRTGKWSRRRPRRAPLIRNNWIGSPVKRDHRYRGGILAPLGGEWVRRDHHAAGGDPIGQSAGEHERHAAAVRQAVGVDARRVDVVGGAQRVDQIGDEPDIRRETSPVIDVPRSRPAARLCRWVHHDEVSRVRKIVPLTRLFLRGWPHSRAVQADD